MSNEYKEWLHDKMADVIFENHLLDEINNYWNTDIPDCSIVEGYFNGKRTCYRVWLDDNGEWRFEQKEMNK